ncbi:hypothetical protein C3B51_22065 [Pseudoalteromonas rubra]|uniref:Uncharacterized protein n=1 Tax=Pseudoalteromonas rubra TaxID=43658 RepID=A0A4Q7DZN0_9GAMM|nr:hypothetical protein C3B51_22065 [Pseudoalteromonas rubra]
MAGTLILVVMINELHIMKAAVGVLLHFENALAHKFKCNGWSRLNLRLNNNEGVGSTSLPYTLTD